MFFESLRCPLPPDGAAFFWGEGEASDVARIVKATQERFKLFGDGTEPNRATARELLELVKWCRESMPPTGRHKLVTIAEVKYRARLESYDAAIAEAVDEAGWDTRNGAHLHERVTGPLLLGLCEGACDRTMYPNTDRFVPDFIQPVIFDNSNEERRAANTEAILALGRDIARGAQDVFDPRCWPTWLQVTVGGVVVSVAGVFVLKVWSFFR